MSRNYLFSAKFCSQFLPKLTRKTLRKSMLADYAFVSESSTRIVLDGLDSWKTLLKTPTVQYVIFLNDNV